MEYKKGPIGITPRDIAIDKFNMERLQGLHEAIVRFVLASEEVPHSWIDEYYEIIRNFNNREAIRSK